MNNIRVFTQRGAQRIGIVLGIQTDFPLIDHCHLMLMKIFDWVLQRNDMGVPLVVDFINNGGECRRFTASGRSRNENQPSFPLIQINNRFRHTERFR